MADDPLGEFVAWLSVAVSAGVMEANAFVLATATPDGRPRPGAVLLKDVGPEAWSLHEHRQPQGPGATCQPQGRRLLRVAEPIARFDRRPVQEVDEAADAYFATRPPGSATGSCGLPVAGRRQPGRARAALPGTGGGVSRWERSQTPWLGRPVSCRRCTSSGRVDPTPTTGSATDARWRLGQSVWP